MWPRGGREGQNGARRDRQRPRLIHRIIRLEYADLNIPLRAGIAIIVFSLNYNIIRVYIYIYEFGSFVYFVNIAEIDSFV